MSITIQGKWVSDAIAAFRNRLRGQSRRIPASSKSFGANLRREFDESQHPRDESGRFAASGAAQDRGYRTQSEIEDEQIDRAVHSPEWKTVQSRSKSLGIEVDAMQPASDLVMGSATKVLDDLEKDKKIGVPLPPKVFLNQHQDFIAAYCRINDTVETDAEEILDLHDGGSQAQKDDAALGWHAIDHIQHTEAAMIHEIGHREHWNNLYKLNPDHAPALFGAWHKEGEQSYPSVNIASQSVSKKEFKMAASKVSGYAKSCPVEFVAETYCGKMMGKTYPPSVEKIYKLFGGPDATPRDSG